MITLITTLAILIAGVYVRMVTQPIGNISRPPHYSPSPIVIHIQYTITVTDSAMSPSQTGLRLIPIRTVDNRPQITLGLTDSHTAIIPLGTEVFADLGDVLSQSNVQVAISVNPSTGPLSRYPDTDASLNGSKPLFLATHPGIAEVTFTFKDS